MTNLIKRATLVLTLLMLTLGSHAFEFTSAGIAYKIVSQSERTCKVVHRDDYAGSIVIPENVNYEGCELSVVGIGQGAFQGCTELTDISIPSTMKEIEGNAFHGCTGLKNVTIPNSVTYLGPAFYGCTNLKSVVIGDLIESIALSQFQGCTSLTDVKLPKSLKSISGYAFNGCSSLRDIEIPSTVETIGEMAFTNTSLTSLILPEALSTIGTWAFAGCAALTSVAIPSSVVSIGDAPFSGCKSLEEISVSADNPNFRSAQGVLYDKDMTRLLQYPCGKDGDYAIPYGVRSIEKYGMSYATRLTSVSMPNTMETLKEQAFANCDNLTHVSISASVANIDMFIFTHSPKLTDVYCYATHIPSTSINAFREETAHATLHVPASVVADYQMSEPWSRFSSIVGMTAEEEALDIEDVTTKSHLTTTSDVYHLSGLRQHSTFKGINISKGKKTLRQ